MDGKENTQKLQIKLRETDADDAGDSSQENTYIKGYIYPGHRVYIGLCILHVA